MPDEPREPAPRDYASVFELLAKQFQPSEVQWRVGSVDKQRNRALALCYIDAREVMDRLDSAVGPENWQNRYPHAYEKTVCEIGLRAAGDTEWVWKSDGAGDTDVEAAKGALSDAFKRAAVRWGIGRYLYDIEAPWVDVVPAGRSYRIADHEYRKLEAILVKYAAGQAGVPAITQRQAQAALPAPPQGVPQDYQPPSDESHYGTTPGQQPQASDEFADAPPMTTAAPPPAIPVMPAGVATDVANKKATSFVNWWCTMVDKVAAPHKQAFFDANAELLLKLRGKQFWSRIETAMRNNGIPVPP
jgi:hypothetical protein